MKPKLVYTTFVLVLCLFSPLAFPDEMKSEQQMTEEQAMKMMMDAATPGEPHKMMANLVGTWETVVKSYMNPSNPTESKGTSTFTSLLDGRYIHETAEGNFMDMQFHGMGIYGYDNVMKKYVSSWVDNFGTGIMWNWGTSEDDGKTIDWSGQSSDPMTGKQLTYRSVMHMMSNDQYHFEMYGPGPDGKEMKVMEITYNRKK